MRLFEVLLITLSFIGVFYVFFSFKNSLVRRLFPIISLLLFSNHAIFEGLRWQMTFVYFVLFLLTIHCWFNIKIKHKLATRSLFVLGLIALLLSASLSYLLPVFSLPKTNGLFHGMTCYKTTQQGLAYKIWFPTKGRVAPQKTTAYHPNPNTAFKGVLGMPSFVFSHVNLVKTSSTAVIKKITNVEKHPLVIYSPGANSTYIDNTALLEEIVSQGYVVAAINHDFNFEKYGLDKQEATKIEIPAQKTLIDNLIKKVVPKQVAHYQQLVDELKQQYSAQIDFNNIALVGHSLGGTTACSGGMVIQQVKAVVNMDGPIAPSIVSNYTVPLLYCSSFSPTLPDSELEAFHVPPLFYRGVKEYELAAVEQLFDQNTNEKFWVRFKTANHLDFTDVPFFIPFLSAPNYDREKGHQLKSSIILSFLDQTLKKEYALMDYSDPSIEWLIINNKKSD